LNDSIIKRRSRLHIQPPASSPPRSRTAAETSNLKRNQLRTGIRRSYLRRATSICLQQGIHSHQGTKMGSAAADQSTIRAAAATVSAFECAVTLPVEEAQGSPAQRLCTQIALGVPCLLTAFSPSASLPLWNNSIIQTWAGAGLRLRELGPGPLLVGRPGPGVRWQAALVWRPFRIGRKNSMRR
jgi:hypothetical protein